ncbi:MAG TPA: ribosomal protein S18-alanine N-acetyltransferase [Terriglobales bacterium]|nr:ribosomal protein S18-alanine N-acetyltransferase [Terriglobales bacterium]
MRGQLFIVAWKFAVRPEHGRDFERAYGPYGDWVRLFHTGDGYLKTELHRDPENSSLYFTLDFWRSREQYKAFRERESAAYHLIDARCEHLTESEELLGDFADLLSLHVALPALGPTTQVASVHTVRPAQADDIPQMLRLEQSASRAAHWPKTAYEAIFQSNAPRRIALVATRLEQGLCGFVIARIVADECELENIVVDPAEIRQGIGSLLLQELSGIARTRGIHRIFLEVRESNSAARELYEKGGFARDGERSAYYSDPVEKAILYARRL